MFAATQCISLFFFVLYVGKCMKRNHNWNRRTIYARISKMHKIVVTKPHNFSQKKFFWHSLGTNCNHKVKYHQPPTDDKPVNGQLASMLCFILHSSHSRKSWHLRLSRLNEEPCDQVLQHSCQGLTHRILKKYGNSDAVNFTYNPQNAVTQRGMST